MIRALVATFILVLPVLVGCGGGSDRPDLVPVKGTVTLDGEPVEGATVYFSCPAAPRSASGVTDSNGNFTLTSYDSGDGAVPGEHVVTIIKVAASGQSNVLTQESAKEMMARNTGMMKGGDLSKAKPELVLPTKYADATTSGEKRTVVAGDVNDFKILLKR